MLLKKVSAFIICLIIPLAVGGLSGYLTFGDIQTWYVTLNKPSFNPPNWLFGPVWTSLYALMGVSLFMVWNRQRNWLRQKALIVFFVQLFLNFWWSLIFFKFHLLFAAALEIILLWATIIYMLSCFKQVKPLAAWLNIPYLLWVSFASVLSAAIWYINR
ncbi:MAG TPA: tryptophan-rich sensory protein [Bacteroidia bacterium]|nr:tryptophan-rich sensory protein [Bacteroidia bacterium]